MNVLWALGYLRTRIWTRQVYFAFHFFFFDLYITHSWQNSIICGCLSDILCNQSGVAIVVVELFQIMGVRHSRYGMPILARRDDETTFSILPAKVQCQSLVY
jgi:hypothetical protein